ncbi:hypothetical protein TCE0_022f06620 [Talaromyces pinophilus]|uniref:Ankyrin repeat protein n=1 Tax=Talaromyces pinophilus TaxID=128442 RepID=A0A6V8HFJ9_TALPI|nr:hypothetical protein TCE0_022f06620 [Talaromyces pinophilus]
MSQRDSEVGVEYGDNNTNMKILAASQRNLDIVRTFRHSRVLHVRVGNSFVTKDIEKVVRHRVTTQLGDVDAELQEYIIDTLTKASNGVYLLAEFQLNDLAQIPEPDIKRYLDLNPCLTELENLYRSIFRKMNSSPKMIKKLAQDCLLWALHSKSNLCSGTFIDAVSLENKSFTKPGSPYDADTLSDVTFWLLNISDLNVIRVKPIHPSLQTFMTNPTTPHPSELQKFFPDKETANAKMAVMCLRRLTLDIEPRDFWDTCLFYCARYFDSHIKNSLSTLPEDLKAMLRQILDEKPEVYLKRILAWRFTAREYGYPKVTCIAAVGFRDVLKKFISGGMDVNQTTDRYTALHCAIRGLSAEYNENTSIIELLLDAGADWNFDARDIPSEIPVECYETLLNTALSYYVDSAVEIIVNHRSFNFAEWIQTIHEKHLDWVRVLIKHGAKWPYCA